MNLTAIVRQSVLASLLGISLCAACSSGGGGAKPMGPTEQPSGDPLFTADGKHFAGSRTYKGECMPAGSRGGCYSVTLEPDGSYRHVLLDAAVSGTYVIEGDEVKLTPSGDMPPQSMTLSADRLQLGDFRYEAAVTGE